MKSKALSLFLLLSLFISQGHSQELTHVSGSVSMSMDERKSFNKVSQGMPVPYGAFIKTGSNSLAVVTFPSGSTLKIDPSSKVEITKQVDSQEKKTTNIYRLIKGAILSKFKSTDESELVVESEHVALAVRGTEFFFGEDGNDYFAAVNSGQVDVVKKDDLDYEPLEAGKALVIEDKKELTKPTQYSWANNLAWGLALSKLTSRSGFRDRKLRAARRKEVKSKIKNLRQRTKRVFNRRMKKRLKKAFKVNRRQTLNRAVKKKLNNTTGAKKVQKFRKKMKKRGLLRRLRN